MRQRINTKRDKEIVKLHKQGFKTSFIALKYGISQRRVREIYGKLDNRR